MSDKIMVIPKDIHLSRTSKLNKILSKRFRSVPTSENLSEISGYWSAEVYNLNKSDIYNGLTEDQKIIVLGLLNRGRLEEAYHIEKAGVSYGAKMVIKSSTYEERQLYALFTADEARHLNIMESYLPSISDSYLENPFLEFLNCTIEEAPKEVLVFIIQVLLEGWGIKHYQSMKDTCNHSDLKNSLQFIINDEVAHHGSGVLLFKEDNLSDSSRDMICSIITDFLNMVRVGPVSILNTIESVVGELSKDDKLLFFNQIEADKSASENLDILKSMMDKSGAKVITEFCHKNNLLKALTVEEMSLL